MKRISFRQGLLAGFALIFVLLGAATLRSWLLVEHVLDHSRRAGEQALQLTAAIQELGERGVDLERSARQFQVLADPPVRRRFDSHLTESQAIVARLLPLADGPLAAALDAWRGAAQAIGDGLDRQLDSAALSPLLARLDESGTALQTAAHTWVERQNGHLLDELEDNRLRLGLQIALALVGALGVALAVGWWLVRPLHQLEAAIGRLGTPRYDEPIRVGGPADLRQLGLRLDWLRQRLGELENERERTLRHVSHELKTPLTALKEGVALLSEEVAGPLADGQREVVGILEHNVGTLQARIESLLRLNATARESRTLQLARVDLPELLAAAVARRELHAQARGLQFIVEAPPGTALLDREKMAVVLDNLLSNAIDFSPAHGVVRFVASRSDGRLRFDCRDSGPGIAAEDAPLIFDPFVQGRRRAPVPRQGSGVGLSIVRELVATMSGAVTLVPSPEGAHFRVEIPDET